MSLPAPLTSHEILSLAGEIAASCEGKRLDLTTAALCMCLQRLTEVVPAGRELVSMQLARTLEWIDAGAQDKGSAQQVH